MTAVVFLEDERLLIIDVLDSTESHSKTAIWGEVVSWLRWYNNQLKEHVKKEESMSFIDLPEGPIQDINYLVQGLASNGGLSESDLIEQLENHAIETIESVDKDALQKAIAGGKLLRSVLTFLVRQNFSPLGCLILTHRDDKDRS